MDEGTAIYYMDKAKELTDKLMAIEDILKNIPPNDCTPTVKEKIDAILEIINN